MQQEPVVTEGEDIRARVSQELPGLDKGGADGLVFASLQDCIHEVLASHDTLTRGYNLAPSRTWLRAKIRPFLVRAIGFFAHWQVQWNLAVARALEQTLKSLEHVEPRVQSLIETRDQRLMDVIEENMRNAQVEQEEVRRRVGLFGLRVRELEEKHRSMQGQMEEFRVRFEQGQEEVRQKEQFLARRLEEEGERLTESVQTLKRDLEERHQNVQEKEQFLARRLEEEGERLTEGARGFTAEMEALLQRHRELFHRYEELRQENILQKRRLDLILTELRRKARLDEDAVQTIAAQGERLLDHTHLLFENRFRGPQEDTRRKQEIYLPVFQSYLHAGAPLLKNGGFVLDLGCGRGEMLEILRGAGIPARGVDVNEDMIHICRQKGLEAIQDDLFHYLASLPDESLAGAISCQVIEHLSAQQNIELLKLLFDKLGWGAKLILETVNPENLLVSSFTFYTDLSHRLKIPAASLSFLAECLGFTILETRYLTPYPEEERFQLLADNDGPVAEKVNENLRRLNTLFFGPRDYALICRKGGE
jgi:O-antigen chain-terminating methyltransferase